MPKKSEPSLGHMIAAARKAIPWSLLQLGEAIGKVRQGGKPVSPQFLNDVEHDRRKPSDELLQDIATVLRLDIDVLRSATGEGLPVVNDYLKAQPEIGPEVVRLFRRAKERGFRDWEKLRKVIEED